MNLKQAAASRPGLYSRATTMLATTLFALVFASEAAAQANFSKAFAPDTIGEGGTSALTFTITASDTATDLEFTDVLPPGLLLATPPSPVLGAGCDPSTAVSAPSGGDTVSFNSPRLGANTTCTLRVDVTGAAAGNYDNISGDLISSAGNSGPAIDTLTIDASRPSFSKLFSSSSVVPGQVIRLSFFFDYSGAGNVFNLSFTDNLPAGLQVATAPDATNTCSGVFTPSSGATSVSFFSGFLTSSTSCELGVDVEVTGTGTFNNRTTNATSSLGSLGFAVDQITSALDPVGLTKNFDDPVAPGGTTGLEFTLTNSTRSTVTGISFTDDLDATLSGLQATGPFPLNPCGSGSSISGSDILTFSGGTLASGASCSFSVEVTVPNGAAVGTYPNTTSSVVSSAGTFSPATDDLDVGAAPVLIKEFCESGAAPTDPCVEVNQVSGGDLITARFTVSNPDPANAVSDLSFTDDFSAFLGGTSVAPDAQNNICGGASGFFDTDGASANETFSLTGGSLAAGTSCTFQVDVQLPANIPPGIYVNQTTPILGNYSSGQVAGNRGVAEVNRAAAPRLSKRFGDPVGAGDTVELQFTLDASESLVDFTNIAFSDDLEAALTGLTVISSAASPCGGALSTGGGSNLSLSGASVAAGESCSFMVLLQVPAGAAPASYPSTSSAVTATAGGEAVVGNSASDNLDVAFIDFQKSFLDDPAVSGGTVTLGFQVDNLGAETLTGLTFTDNLNAVLAGLMPTDAPQSDICGAGSSLTFSAGVLTLNDGNLAVGNSCSFTTVLQVPAGTTAGEYSSVTSSLSGSVDGSPFVFSGAADSLLISDPLLLSKEFIDDPAIPGGAVTLAFTLTNASLSETISSIAFTDDLGAVFAGLVSESGTQSGVCGGSSQLSGTGVLSLTGAELSPGATCTFSATLRIPASASGSSLNTTSMATGIMAGEAVEGIAASDMLRINSVTFAKSFSGPVGATSTVTLSFTLENLDASNGVTGLSFTDDLDAVIPGLVATDTPQVDVCGDGSQLSGTSLLAFTGGELGPGESCTFDVELQVPASATPGSFTNTTSNLSSNGLPASAPASASLQIEPPPAFGKVFMPNAITLGGTTRLSFTIDNSASAAAVNSLMFTDNLPAGLAVAGTPNASSTCTGGTVMAVAGTGTVELSGASVAAGGQCTIQVDIVSSAEGTFVNTSGALTSSSGDSGTATDTLDVVTGDFVVIKSFRTQPVLPGGLVEMELSFVNGSGFGLTGIALTDDLGATLSGLAAEGLPSANVCGAGSQVSGASTVSLTGGSLPAGGSCTVVVPLRVPAGAPTGTFTNTTSVATGNRGGVLVQAPADSADLVVAPLAFTQAFAPASVAAGNTTTVTFEITNPDPANAVTGLAFTDDLEAFIPGMTAASTPINAACGAGSLVDGTSAIALTDGALAAGGTCSFQVELDVPADTIAGDYTSVTSDLTSNLGNSGNATAVLTVVVVGPAASLPMLSTMWLFLLTLLLAGIGWRSLSTAGRT